MTEGLWGIWFSVGMMAGYWFARWQQARSHRKRYEEMVEEYSAEMPEAEERVQSLVDDLKKASRP